MKVVGLSTQTSRSPSRLRAHQPEKREFVAKTAAARFHQMVGEAKPGVVARLRVLRAGVPQSDHRCQRSAGHGGMGRASLLLVVLLGVFRSLGFRSCSGSGFGCSDFGRRFRLDRSARQMPPLPPSGPCRA